MIKLAVLLEKRGELGEAKTWRRVAEARRRDVQTSPEPTRLPVLPIPLGEQRGAGEGHDR
jgi:hypothetical protein